MKTLGILEKSKNFWFLFTNLVLLFFLRLPSLFEPYWYGDEGIYQVLGMGINRGRLLYQGVFDNKPPLLYALYSFFDGDQFAVRLLSLLFGLLSVVIFFYLAKTLFKKRPAYYISTLFFTICFGLPVIEGNIANAENFMMPLILASMYLVLNRFKDGLKNKKLFLSGALLGIAFLFKIVGLFDFTALTIFLLIIKTPDISKKAYVKILTELKNLSSLILGFIIPIAVCAIFFIFKGAYSEFATATFFSNIGYVGHGNKFIIPQGLLILKIILLFTFALFVFLKRKKLTVETVFIWIWLAFSVFNALFAQRPYTHYLLTLLPSFSLLLGLIINEIKARRLNILIAILLVFLAYNEFWIYTKNTAYYKNFIEFVVNGKSVPAYQGFFDRKTPIDYQIAQYIKRHTSKEDSIFIWGNNAQLYKLTNKLPPGKYTVAYHIKNYKDGIENTEKGLTTKPPKLIILMHNVGKYPFSLVNYKFAAIIGNVTIYEKIL